MMGRLSGRRGRGRIQEEVRGGLNGWRGGGEI